MDIIGILFLLKEKKNKPQKKYTDLAHNPLHT